MPKLRVMTYNIFYGGVGREASIRDVVARVQPDVAVFTEVTAEHSFEKIADVVGTHVAGRDGRGRAECPVIVSRYPITRSETYGPPWSPRKWISATIQSSARRAITVHGIHFVPHVLWPFELCRVAETFVLLRHLRASAETDHVLAGDFNAISGSDRPRVVRTPVRVRAQWVLQGGQAPRWALNRLQRAGFVDCYRVCNATQEGFTVPAWDPGMRLDYVFASPGLRRCVRGSATTSSALRPAPSRSLPELLGWRASTLGGHASDHLALWADFEWPGDDASG